MISPPRDRDDIKKSLSDKKHKFNLCGLFSTEKTSGKEGIRFRAVWVRASWITADFISTGERMIKESRSNAYRWELKETSLWIFHFPLIRLIYVNSRSSICHSPKFKTRELLKRSGIFVIIFLFSTPAALIHIFSLIHYLRLLCPHLRVGRFFFRLCAEMFNARNRKSTPNCDGVAVEGK